MIGQTQSYDQKLNREKEKDSKKSIYIINNYNGIGRGQKFGVSNRYANKFI
jgi:hypothetical protein